MSYNGYYVSFPRMRREFDSLHPHQEIVLLGFKKRTVYFYKQACYIDGNERRPGSSLSEANPFIFI